MKHFLKCVVVVSMLSFIGPSTAYQDYTCDELFEEYDECFGCDCCRPEDIKAIYDDLFAGECFFGGGG